MMANNLYCPFVSEDPAFCEIFTCAEFASWVCFPQGILTHPVLLCDQHKHERVREEGKQLQWDVEQIEADVRLALQDVDPNDAKVLWERCSQILDDIHADRF